MTAAAKHIKVKNELATTLAKVAAAHATWSAPALWAVLAAYVLLGGLTWFCYLRSSVLTQRFPSLAAETI
jgi:NNP family nitrate/nitrite transporter-like MFS transporter